MPLVMPIAMYHWSALRLMLSMILRDVIGDLVQGRIAFDQHRPYMRV